MELSRNAGHLAEAGQANSRRGSQKGKGNGNRRIFSNPVNFISGQDFFLIS